MAKKAMINKEKRREELAAKGKYPTVRLHNRWSHFLIQKSCRS